MAPVPSTPVRVLVIDDDPVMRELLTALLSTDEHTVNTAESGEAALARLRGGLTTDIILTDLQLPGLSGAALAAQLRRLAPGARLLGMSGSEPAPETRAMFNAFLLKPFSPEDFAAAVHSVSRPGTSEPPPTPAATAESLPAPLDEATYARLAATIPPAQLAELYQLTLDDVSARLTEMRAALAASDLAAFRREAHALKGGCGMVGALELAGLAARAEAGSLDGTHALDEFAAAEHRLRSMITARSTMRKLK